MIFLRVGCIAGVVGLALGLCVEWSWAEGNAPKPKMIRVIGREAVTVTAGMVRLEDVAEVSSPQISDDEAVIALKKLEIVASPAPGQSTTVAAMAVLERLRAANVDFNQIGYSLPSIVTITRAGRIISADEVRGAIEGLLASQQREVTIKQVKYDSNVVLAPGVTSISAEPLFSPSPAQLSFMITARVSGSPDVRFKAVAAADEWKEVPVAARALPRGAVVESTDVVMARMNAATLPRDLADNPASIVGLSTSSGVSYGEAFQRSKLAIPPVISAGSPVTMIVRTATLEATASGVALEAGIEGQEIKVRNEASKRVVTG
ncbi:MAG: flagella basal body P-ring formation protein FlgA, partial [Proteobacteria bacterium]|nr:flagella basal body P-ring formation protein FlgA [Pseudomonadota bacterium]